MLFDDCVVCAEPVVVAAVLPCHHTTCHRCTFRQRALYRKTACLVCRTECERVVMTDTSGDYELFTRFVEVKGKPAFGCVFASEEARDTTLGLLEFRCPKCLVVVLLFKKLNAHCRDTHQLEFCNLCAQFKHAFVLELELMTKSGLQRHSATGDKRGFSGHPQCPFCHSRWYSEDEWNAHMKHTHERCHVCDQIDSRHPRWFKHYELLQKHFDLDHYACHVLVCRDMKFVVFQDEFELQLHMAKEHPQLAGATINIQPAFGSQLSTFRAPRGRDSARRDERPRATEPLEEGDSAEVKRMRLQERARHYLGYDTALVDRFNQLNLDYRQKKMDAAALLREYAALFTLPDADIGLVVQEFADLFPNGGDRALRQAWDASQKAPVVKKDKFPVLRGGSAALGGALWAGKAGSRGGAPPPVRPVVGGKKKQFPALGGSSSNSIFAPAPAPTVKYTTILRKSQKPVVNTYKEPVDFKPGWLGNGSSRSATPPDVSGLALDPRFPTLPASTRKEIPRVNPVRHDLGVWGRPAEPAPEPTPVPQPAPRKGKKNKKGELLFHIGI